jgi:hypothetical protein
MQLTWLLHTLLSLRFRAATLPSWHACKSSSAFKHSSQCHHHVHVLFMEGINSHLFYLHVPSSLLQALFPDNSYSHDSGGDPEVIPQLTFEQFQDFHARYYHPSNGRFWFYGDDDATKRLQILDAYLRCAAVGVAHIAGCKLFYT